MNIVVHMMALTVNKNNIYWIKIDIMLEIIW